MWQLGDRKIEVQFPLRRANIKYYTREKERLIMAKLRQTEMVELIAKIAGTSKVAAKEQLDTIRQAFTEAVQNGDDIELRSFLTIKQKDVPEKQMTLGFNGKTVTVPAHKKITAKVTVPTAN